MRRVMILCRKFEWKVNLYSMITAHKKQNLRHGDKHLKQTPSLKLFSWFFVCSGLQLTTSSEETISCKTWMLNM